jgi:C7-cyclitol 7-kinase
MARRHLVFDVGGTLLRAAVYDEAAGALADVARVDAPSFARLPGQPWAALRGRLVEEMSALRSGLASRLGSSVDPHATFASVTIAFPGPVDGARRVLAAPTLWGGSGEYPYALERDLGEAWPGTDVHVLNDVTAAGYRYLRGRDDDFCVVTVSTGIGNKVFVGGRPLAGRSGLGGEIGHLQVDATPGALPCDCGGRGHLGAIASGRGALALARARAQESPPEGPSFGRSALVREMNLTPKALTAEALATAYRLGDAWTAGVVREGAAALGAVLAAIHLAVGVDRFVLIGGFALGLGARYCDEVGATLAARCWHGVEAASTPTLPGGAGGGRVPVPGALSVSLGEADGHCALLGAGRARHLGLLSPTLDP